MPKKFRPTTPGQRKLVLPVLLELMPGEKKSPKSLRQGKRRGNGRNHSGHITCRHKGGGHKKLFRTIDFKRDKENIPAKVTSVEYDPNRSALIALLVYGDGEKRYIVAPQGIKVGSMVQTSDDPPFRIGCCMRLKFMPLGSVIHNIEMKPGCGAQLVRSAGLSAQLLARSGGYATVRMPSGEVRMIHENCRATFGAVSNAEHNLRVIGKAGRSRWMGIRPTVRGVAMNPVDHPHGGGEGRGKGNHPQTPWAQFTKGFRTRAKRKTKKWIVKARKRERN
ncbi:MAG: 50S ribosomal protein L2 [Chlamydiae bacterium RIFCSPHIGHO2_12_FULL_44_59]|nr:MAG: 50S ribosomal protein L2 [Chlamydiae bacterium RIFCSPHIGHO2_01_FULL_44_39]OGN58580.1 MAG: 50S ribosomal protein L2 [Chlamydiae bacterium RIFCSPHIGHO2_02_FULL_45_9]OGN60528.1 MAG: 50S ribosomal protein L2 [Chlamydiae bacterium RIFCSPHIGHO2_12_FULL_44_59]OGN65983.1 MAG: 50S ribosomal protein L2 [Chlamydiae bacterium RIFCSPLOWO2_01_FULL_44_52]OGN68798.1 MAG: 50S ribosomal protein L2 [Chlamydiae bacterium RIFCSPLOWO2_02_FULL_45_22]OGN70438.1 MAG: 50S ribosomal protein L2 [Chlamydiae bacter